MAAKRRAAQMREQLRMPPAPVGLRVTDVNDDSVELEWCSAEDHPPKGFDVQWKLYQIQWESERHVPTVQEEEPGAGHEALLPREGRRTRRGRRRTGLETTRRRRPLTTFTCQEEESPILKRAASEFMQPRRKPFGDASNKQPARHGAPQKKPHTARKPPSTRPGGWFELRDANGRPTTGTRVRRVGGSRRKVVPEKDPTSGVAYYTDGNHRRGAARWLRGGRRRRAATPARLRARARAGLANARCPLFSPRNGAGSLRPYQKHRAAAQRKR